MRGCSGGGGGKGRFVLKRGTPSARGSLPNCRLLFLLPHFPHPASIVPAWDDPGLGGKTGIEVGMGE